MSLTAVKTTLQKGHAAEEAAGNYLQQQGLHLLQRNYRARHYEIDIIMQDGDYIVFVEVRYRAKAEMADILESVTRQKQLNIIRAATYYLVSHDKYDKIPCRFDVIGMRRANHQEFELTWIKNAFEA